MSRRAEERQKKQLLKQQDWDTHNKKAEHAAQAYQDYMATDSIHNKPKKKTGKRLLIVLAVLVVLALVGAGLYMFVFNNKDDSKQTASQAEDVTAVSTAESTASVATKDFTSSNFGLSFKYPENWTVDESSADKLLVTSSKTSITTASGTKTSGKIVMSIRAKGQPLAEFDKGTATATQASELLKYTNPTPAQRANTYLTFAAFTGATSGIDGLYITGDYGYQKGQGISKADMSNIDPVINVTFGQCGDAACTKTTGVTISNESWSDKTFSDPIRNMLQSISIQ